MIVLKGVGKFKLTYHRVADDLLAFSVALTAVALALLPSSSN